MKVAAATREFMIVVESQGSAKFAGPFFFSACFCS